MHRLLLGLFTWLMVACLTVAGGARAQALQPPPAAGLRVATFAGGCFWCMVPPFEGVPGVSAVVSGYTGGTVANPAYAQVSSGRTGHKEAVQVTYDPARVSFNTLLDLFWRNVDPFDAGGQFCDRGNEYATSIFAGDAGQRALAEASKAAVQARFGKAAATPVVDAGPFYRAEDYHQDYHSRNPVRYSFYRYKCGRDARLNEVWGAEAGGKAVVSSR